MAYIRHFDEPEPVLEPACIHLRSKAMYVTGELRNSDHPDESGSHYCWCNMTQHIVGPDGEEVDRPACIPGRGCFRETYE